MQFGFSEFRARFSRQALHIISRGLHFFPDGASSFFLGIYLRKSRPGEKRYRDTSNMSDVDEGPDMDDE
ncbi:hypothetical protein KAI78_03460 [bacterium]|nr:hypothetical protein [bacterium]